MPSLLKVMTAHEKYTMFFIHISNKFSVPTGTIELYIPIYCETTAAKLEMTVCRNESTCVAVRPVVQVYFRKGLLDRIVVYVLP